MWVELSVGGAADLAKRNPEPPTGGEAYTDLLYEVPPHTTYIYFYYMNTILK
jgi:hypothetical protein